MQFYVIHFWNGRKASSYGDTIRIMHVNWRFVFIASVYLYYWGFFLAPAVMLHGREGGNKQQSDKYRKRKIKG